MNKRSTVDRKNKGSTSRLAPHYLIVKEERRKEGILEGQRGGALIYSFREAVISHYSTIRPPATHVIVRAFTPPSADIRERTRPVTPKGHFEFVSLRP